MIGRGFLETESPAEAATASGFGGAARRGFRITKGGDAVKRFAMVLRLRLFGLASAVLTVRIERF